MPEENAEQTAAREADEAKAATEAAAATDNTDNDTTGADEVAAARAEAEAARAAATEAQTSATEQEAALARKASELADKQLAFAERAAKAGDKSFPKEVVEKARQEAAATRVKLRDSEAEVQRLKDAAKTDVERLTGEGKAFEQRAIAAEQKLARLTVGAKKGLPAELAERLIGEDEAALEKDADKLLKTVKPPAAGLDQGARGGGGGGTEGGSGTGKGAAVRSMNDFIRSHGGRQDVPGRSGGTSA